MNEQEMRQLLEICDRHFQPLMRDLDASGLGHVPPSYLMAALVGGLSCDAAERASHVAVCMRMAIYADLSGEPARVALDALDAFVDVLEPLYLIRGLR